MSLTATPRERVAAALQAQQPWLPPRKPRTPKAMHLQGTPPLHPAERRRLESELGCLRREATVTQRGIAHLEQQLGTQATPPHA